VSTEVLTDPSVLALESMLASDWVLVLAEVLTAQPTDPLALELELALELMPASVLVLVSAEVLTAQLTDPSVLELVSELMAPSAALLTVQSMAPSVVVSEAISEVV
jgi:hypothetical protein